VRVACGGLLLFVLVLIADANFATRLVECVRYRPAAAPGVLATDSPRDLTPQQNASVLVVSEDNDDASVDLYGNAVSDAVAKYTLDPTGSLYELHSPQTELPRLGSPKS
jgi:hypothetical protein